jgi:hypothetical protein
MSAINDIEPTTPEEWADLLADAIRALLDDTSEGRALRTLRLYEAWVAEGD